MKVTGIIAECNPLHEGHIYLLQEARKRTDADYVIVALSGDYVQRGAPSIVSKELRTEALLREGADLVLELPLYAACAGADYFARGAAALLESTGVVTDLAFGSECGDITKLQKAADLIKNETNEYSEILQRGLRTGLTYPEARSNAAGSQGLPSSPNDLLGTEYLKALALCHSTITPHAILRTQCRSASDIRSDLLAKRRRTDPILCRDDFSDHLLHALYNAAEPEDLSCFLDVSQDLAGRILHELPYFDTFSSFTDAVKTRNYTYTRVSRALMHILLGMRTEVMQDFDSRFGLCGWIRPIGFRRTARPLLRSIAAGSSVPFLDKLSRADELLSPGPASILREEIRAEFLYDIMAARRTGKSADGVKPGPAKQMVII